MCNEDSTALTRGINRRAFLAVATLGATLASRRELLAVDVNGQHVAWLNEVQRAPAKQIKPEPHLEGLVDRNGAAIDTAAKWQSERMRIRAQWLDFLGPLSRAERPAPMLEVIDEDHPGADVIRQRVRYRVEQQQVVEAYLLRPRERTQRRPAVAVFHSTVAQSIRQPAGLEGRTQLAFGLGLARRGFVALCPRNYLWTSGTLEAHDQANGFLARHPKSKGMARMLYDAQIAVDLLVAQPDVDRNRIGAVGHSLGAKEVLYLAAFDERIRATVSSEGGIGVRFSNWDAPWYLGEAINSEDFSFEHHQLLALVAPRAFLLVGGDSADGDRSWPFIASALPIYQLTSGDNDRPRVGLFNHRQGHAVPPDAERRIYEWLMTYV